MEGAGKGGKEGVDVRCLSLEELEAMNRDLEERAASSVAAAEQALRSVQLKEEDIQQNAEKLVQLAARKATQPDSHGKENRSERLESSQKRSQQARPASARHKPTQQLANKSHATPDSKSTKESEAGPVKFTRPSSSSSSRPSSSVPRSSEKQKSQQESPQMHSSFPSDFDLPSRPDAQVRLYKARIKALEADLYAQETLLSQRTKELSQKDVLVKQLKANQVKVEKENRAMRLALEKYHKTTDKLRTDLQEKEKLLDEANRHGDKASREKTKIENDMKSREVRMQRAIEEIDRYKSMVEDMKSLEKDRRYVNREDHLKMIQEKTKLEKQKNELLSVFKKQTKLVDVLKRQKVHLEAATALKFTENEFLKTLELSAP